jgi:hypothetical protein
MTPLEKSEDMIMKFYYALPNNGSITGINNINDRWNEAKKCALIAVDEIIEFLAHASKYLAFPEQIKYWQEVKQEIEIR